MGTTRRGFILQGAAALAVFVTRSTALGAASIPTLHLVRARGWDKLCPRCIPGKLFGKDGFVEQELCDTVELSFEDNKVGRSSIPAGRYIATVRVDKTKRWMDELTAWRLELLKVPGPRTAIQFHYGKDVHWSQGCIILGVNASAVCPKSPCAFSDSPRKAVEIVRDYVMTRTRSSSDTVEVLIE